ncbi:MAG: family glycosyltransferase [Noviherbaspirillum sp.]|nr:family glycosyltransferase [Noviherbaspirillum sp.]
MVTPLINIISPATANANNGNWHTASRWAGFLGERYRVAISTEWNGEPCNALVALHARRSSASLEKYAAAFPLRPSVLILTGTDLYRDIGIDADAQRSLRLATRLVVLQEAGLQELEPILREKTRVIHQSVPAVAARRKRSAPDASNAGIIMIGHLRIEKDPLTFMRAAALLHGSGVRMTHIGGALDPALGEQARATEQSAPHYRWLGDLPHAATLEALQQNQLMVITSLMEGGAHVIIEAIVSGVPVLASDISGNRGMLGTDYAGYFPVGDSRALARMIEKAVSDPGFYALLQAQCDARAALFLPEREQAAVLQLMDNLAPGSAAA